MRALLTVAATAMVAITVGACGGDDDTGRPTLSFYTFNEPSGAYEEAAKRCSRASNGRYDIELAILPPAADAQREQLVRRLAAEDEDIDIIAMDVIWTAEFAEAGWIEEWTGRRRSQAEEDRIDGPVRSATYEDKLYAAPFTSNTQLLWYRKDRVRRPPETWEEMIEQAEEIGEKGTIQVQGAQYEGLTVWFNSLLASAGGQVLSDPETVSLEEPAVEAARVISEVARSSAADPSLSNNMEDQGRLAFQDGNSSFMVNYPFVFPSANEEAPDVARNMGAARYPGVEGSDRPSSPPLGGINLGIGAFSPDKDLAFEAALCLAEPENQVVAATKGGLPPTRESLYGTREIEEAYPGFADLIRESLEDAQPRPVSPAYNDISLAIQKTLHPPNSIDPEQVAEELREQVEKAVNSEGLL